MIYLQLLRQVAWFRIEILKVLQIPVRSIKMELNGEWVDTSRATKYWSTGLLLRF